MTLSELLALLTLLVAAAALMVEVAKAGFDIAWKVAHDRSKEKQVTVSASYTDGCLLSLCIT